jgi:hypothetical protein
MDILKKMFDSNLNYIFNNMTLTRSLLCVGYLFNAVAWFLLASRFNKAVPDDKIIISRILSLSITIVLVLMVINRIFDLDIRWVEAYRELAKTHGWYGQRYMIQIFSIAFIAVVGTIFFISSKFGTSNGLLRYQHIFRGTILLMTFIVIRAISYHVVDQILNLQIKKYQISSILELGFVYLIGLLLFNSLFLAKNRGRHKVTSAIRYI